MRLFNRRNRVAASSADTGNVKKNILLCKKSAAMSNFENMPIDSAVTRPDMSEACNPAYDMQDVCWNILPAFDGRPAKNEPQSNCKPLWPSELHSNKLNLFDMKQVIGKGSYGKVVLVQKKGMAEKKFYAMKVMNKVRLGKEGIDDVLRERSIMSGLSFCYIAKLEMSFQTKQKLFMVLEFCSGGDLRFHMKRLGKIDQGSVIFYTAEMALALQYLNDRNIVFRDLKAENVLLDAEGHIKLSDFGMAKRNVASWNAGASTVCGTPNTMAPEVFVHDNYGHSCDWWSLGIVTYEMLASRLPFWGRTRDELIGKILRDRVRVMRSWPDTFKHFFCKIFMKHPEARLGAIGGGSEVLQHDLFTEPPHALDMKKLMLKELPAPMQPSKVQLKSNDNAAKAGTKFQLGSDGRQTKDKEKTLVGLNVDETQLLKDLGGGADQNLQNFDSIRNSNVPVPEYKLTALKNDVISADDLDAAAPPPPPPPIKSLNAEGFTYDELDELSEHGPSSFEAGNSDRGHECETPTHTRATGSSAGYSNAIAVTRRLQRIFGRNNERYMEIDGIARRAGDRERRGREGERGKTAPMSYMASN